MKLVMRMMLLVLVMITGCKYNQIKETKAPQTRREPSTLIDYINKSTVALIKINESEEGDIIYPNCTGVWISENKILTAAHCLTDEDTVMYIGYQDIRGLNKDPGMVYYGIVEKVNHIDDLGLIRTYGNIPSHEIAKIGKEEPGVGERLSIVGHVSGLYWTYIEGIVGEYWSEYFLHGTNRIGLMQVSAPVYYGHSGSGAWDRNGYLVGIGSFIDRGPSIGFYVELSEIKKFIQ